MFLSAAAAREELENDPDIQQEKLERQVLVKAAPAKRIPMQATSDPEMWTNGIGCPLKDN